MSNNLEIGKIGEDIAEYYIRQHGNKILQRNCKAKFGEIDIIFRLPDTTLVFLEVKTMKHGPGYQIVPEDHMTSSKINILKRMALYCANSNIFPITNFGWRIDCITISIPECSIENIKPNTTVKPLNLLTSIIKDCKINYYENIG